SLPRLREMFSGQGMQLLDVGVGDQNAARQQMAQREASPQTGGRAGVHRGASVDEVVVSTRAVPLPRHARLLDAYASAASTADKTAVLGGFFCATLMHESFALDWRFPTTGWHSVCSTPLKTPRASEVWHGESTCKSTSKR